MPSNTPQNKLNLTKELIPNLVHSIRNPLSVLKLNHYFINLHRRNLPEEIAASIDDCSKAALKMEQYLDKISQLYSASSQNCCSLNEIVSTAAEILEISARRKNLVFVKEFQELPPLFIDRTKLLQAAIIFILNVLESDFAGDKLYLITRISGRDIFFEVKGDRFNDDGCTDFPGLNRELIEDFLGNNSEIFLELIQYSTLKISFNMKKAEGNLLEIQNTDCR